MKDWRKRHLRGGIKEYLSRNEQEDTTYKGSGLRQTLRVGYLP
jgi:hypothetical protein